MKRSDVQMVRAFGSERVHLARVRDDDIVDATFLGRPGPKIVALDPVATLCGAQLRAARGQVLLMRRDQVTCTNCKRVYHHDRGGHD